MTSCVQALSVACEKMFSIAGIIQNAKRRSMSAVMFFKLVNLILNEIFFQIFVYKYQTFLYLICNFILTLTTQPHQKIRFLEIFLEFLICSLL